MNLLELNILIEDIRNKLKQGCSYVDKKDLYYYENKKKELLKEISKEIKDVI